MMNYAGLILDNGTKRYIVEDAQCSRCKNLNKCDMMDTFMDVSREINTMTKEIKVMDVVPYCKIWNPGR